MSEPGRSGPGRWARLAEASTDASVIDDFRGRAPGDRREAFLELTWPDLHANGVSWAGFYLEVPGAPEGERLVLEACRGGPACSPIGLHGACGRAYLEATPLIVRDVTELGEGYIACDPRDRSELVVPLFADNRPFAVLDLDSHDLAAFGAPDLAALLPALERLGLGSPPPRP